MSELQKQRTIENNKARKGKPVSYEALLRIREGIKNRASRKGIKLGKYSDERLLKLREWAKSPERRKHLSEVFTGRKFTEETLSKMSVAQKNRLPLTEEQKTNHRMAMNRPEVREKCSKGRKGKPPTRGTTGRKMPEKEKQEKSMKSKGIPVSPERLEKLRANAKNPLIREKIKNTLLKIYESEEMRRKRSESSLKVWREDPDMHKKVFCNWGKGINKTEQKLLEILNELYPGEWVFVGNGQKSVAGKCPDFIHADQRKIIELFGNYWHKQEEEEVRKKFFSENGYDCAVIWEYDMKKMGKNYIQKVVNEIL